MKKNLYHLSFALLLSGICGHSQAQFINTIAGNGTPGYVGTSGSATAAELFHPKAMATDDSGNVYIADADNNVIRRVDRAGNISTIAGFPAGGFSGDGGLAVTAGLNRPNGIAIDHSHNIYICDADNQRVRKINAAGIITTVAGNGIAGYNGDGGLADTSELYNPGGIALDKYGNLYIADENNNLIRKVDAAGIITSFAGNGSLGFSGDGGPATAATIGFPFGVACDTAGNVFFSLTFEDRICKVDPSGTMTTYAGVGSGIGGFGGDHGPATAASIDNPWGIATDLAGNVYIADFANERIRKVDLTGTITTVAGNGLTGYSPDGTVATSAKLKDPAGVHADATGNIYIADYNNHRVRKVSIVNHAPYFVNGASQSISICADAPAFPIDTLLAALDSDNAQLEAWSLVAGPMHGTLVSAYGVFSNGTTLTPTGLSYTPAAGYAGNDSFKVKVSDGIGDDTITVYVKDSLCATTSASLVSKPPTSHFALYPNPGNGSFTCALSSMWQENVTVVVTNVAGKKVKEYTTQTNQATTMDISVPGVYFIRATSAHEHWSDKIIVTK